MGQYCTSFLSNINQFSFEVGDAIVNKKNLEPVFLCVGNSNVVGDLFGPYCGEILKNTYKVKNVFGDLNHNITYKNLKTTYLKIKDNFKDNPLIIIDSALGSLSDVGNVKFLKYGCIPAYLNNNQIMGDFSIFGITNVAGINNFLFLKTVKFKMVEQMASFCCLGIFESLNLLNRYANLKNNNFSLKSSKNYAYKI